jgi:hypothetical protein
MMPFAGDAQNADDVTERFMRILSCMTYSGAAGVELMGVGRSVRRKMAAAP